jgi:GGDEF domain-containing protein
MASVEPWADAAVIAARLMLAVQQPLELAGQKVFPTVSIGAAVSTRGTVADELLAEADLAMYAAKADGRGRRRLAGGS